LSTVCTHQPLPPPLAERLRPRSLEAFAGQRHLLAPGRPLRRAIEAGRPYSMVLWGPPGSGKTTLARMIAHYASAQWLALSAVLAGVKDIREAVRKAEAARARGQATILFVDEAHRFNKAQQDAFLPYVEDGTLIFIGATTENPSFALNGALLSRVQVHILKPLAAEELEALLDRGLAALGEAGGAAPECTAEARRVLLRAADGDARRLLTLLELAVQCAAEAGAGARVETELARQVCAQGLRRFDRGGDYFYDQISALHKSVRGSDPDAALYWLARMIDGGCDPLYIARRLLRMASEDVGNADPRALGIALDAWETQHRLGSPEGELALAQAAVYLACAPKSNAVYRAWNAAVEDARRHGSLEVPLHLRNAPTELMRQTGHGRGYRYPHDEPEGYAAGVRYFPEGMPVRRYYRPVPRGWEQRIAERLAELRRRDAARSGRPDGGGGEGEAGDR